MADTNKCPQCGAPIAANTHECPYCGEAIVRMSPQPNMKQSGYPQPGYQQPGYQQPGYQQPGYQQPGYQQPGYPYPGANPSFVNNGINPSWPIKNKAVAAVLAIFFGGFGIHKFYLGQSGLGVLYLLFCWTGIPSFIGFVEGIIYLVSNDHNFQVKNRVRLQ